MSFNPTGSQEVQRARLPLPQVWLACPRVTQTLEAPHRGSCHAALWPWTPPALFSLLLTEDLSGLGVPARSVS